MERGKKFTLYIHFSLQICSRVFCFPMCICYSYNKSNTISILRKPTFFQQIQLLDDGPNVASLTFNSLCLSHSLSSSSSALASRTLSAQMLSALTQLGVQAIPSGIMDEHKVVSESGQRSFGALAFGVLRLPYSNGLSLDSHVFQPENNTLGLITYFKLYFGAYNVFCD